MPILTAVSSSSRQLFLLLRCISFAPRAQVHVSEDGLRFSVEDSRVMQGLAFLDKSLFTTYRFESPTSSSTVRKPNSSTVPSSDADPSSLEPNSAVPPFQIHLTALLETLSIFGTGDSTSSKFSNSRDPFSNSHNNGSFTAIAAARMASGSGGIGGAAFDNRVLGLSSICRLSYDSVGSPLCITLEEGNVTTTCELVTFEPDVPLNGDDEDDEVNTDIPFNRDALVQKVIMRSSLLYDAITELALVSPERVWFAASPKEPHFTLYASGDLGSANVEFPNDPQLLETFQVQTKTINSYKFDMIHGAAKAMATAKKVSIRGDEQGVLSLQFMVELDPAGTTVSFVDFRFVPYISENGDDDDDEDEDS